MRVPSPERALLTARTVRHLRPRQVAHRVRLRAQKVAFERAGRLLAPRLRRPAPPHARWPQGFMPTDAQVAEGFPSAEANAEGRFSFLGEERRLGEPADWVQLGAPQLWRYHLHYFDWAWAFAAHPDRDWARAAFARLWRSWGAATSFGRWDAWSPYVVSLRTWALCGVHEALVAGGPDEDELVSDLALHAGFVRANLELDVGGNHLVKNLKALVGAGVFLDDEPLIRLATRHLGAQLATQVLDDGGHFERSPSYHCQVLADLVDVAGLLGAAGRPPVHGLDDAVAAMRRWLGAMLMPDGDVPLFNDCTLVGHHRLKLLDLTPPPPRRLTVLQPSGYVVMRPGERIHLVADVGPPCPPELPAHAHADCLSFELAVDGRRIVVDTGTSTYEAGERRSYERSTRAHNTVEVDSQDQTEVWGAFRAARRAEPTLERAVDDITDDDTPDHGPPAAGPDTGADTRSIEVVAFHDGYRRLPGRPRHRRTWRASPAAVEISDEVTGSGTGTHHAVARLHLTPGLVPRGLPEGCYDVGPVRVTLTGGTSGVDEVEVATAFGGTETATCLGMSSDGPLPRRLATTIEIAPADRRPGA